MTITHAVDWSTTGRLLVLALALLLAARALFGPFTRGDRRE